MNIPFTPGEAFITPPPLKDSSLSIISAYHIVPFDEQKSDAACIYRLVEIYLLNRLNALSDNLREFTGLSLPDPEVTAGEINHLLSRCEKLCLHEQEELSFRQRDASGAEYRVTQAKGGAKSLSEARERTGSRGAEEERQYNQALTLLESQKQRTGWFMSLPGLLHPVAESLVPDVNKSLLNKSPKTPHLPECFTRDNIISNSPLFRAGADALAAVRELEKAAKFITDKCSLPKDRYELNNNGMFRAEAYRHYYRPDNRILQAIISPDEYVRYATELQQGNFSKARVFK